MAEAGPVQCELNSDTDSNCQHQYSRHAGNKAFSVPAAPSGSEHQAPYQHHSSKHLLEADKTEFQESVIPQALQQDPAGTAEDQELNPCIPVLSPAPQHAESKNQKQDCRKSSGNPVGCKIAQVIGVLYNEKAAGPGAFRKRPADVESVNPAFRQPFRNDKQAHSDRCGIQDPGWFFPCDPSAQPRSEHDTADCPEQAPAPTVRKEPGTEGDHAAEFLVQQAERQSAAHNSQDQAEQACE